MKLNQFGDRIYLAPELHLSLCCNYHLRNPFLIINFQLRIHSTKTAERQKFAAVNKNVSSKRTR